MLTWDDIGIVIRAVPGQREASLAFLTEQIRDFAPEGIISWHGAGRTVPESYADALASWRNREWVLQFEDDVVLSPDFAIQALRLMNERTDVGLVSFYSGRRLKLNERPPTLPILEYLPGARFLMAQAVALRIRDVSDHNAFMIAWTGKYNRPYGTDTATALWLKSRRLRLARAWPSLVQHRALRSMCHQKFSTRPHASNPMRTSPSFEAVYGSVECIESFRAT